MKMKTSKALLYLATADRNLEICDEAKEILWELVERDTPMKPISSRNASSISKHCICDKVVMPYRFCPKCGQRLDWSE